MTFAAVAAGEIKQRLREPGFLLLLVALAALATYLAPSPGSSYTTLSVGRSGIFGGSALAGTTSGMDFSIFAGFFCIFALGSGFARDDRTRLSELLRAQPVSTAALVLGRVASSWALGAVLVTGGMLLLGITLAFRQGASFEPLPYARNFLLLALPAMAVIASLAVLLDILVGKWRGALVAAGIVGYLALLSFTIAGPSSGRLPAFNLDLSGIRSVESEFDQTFGGHADLSGGLDIEEHPGKPIFWKGLAPTRETVVRRLFVLGEAAAIGLLALGFYRRRAGVKSTGAAAIERGDAVDGIATSVVPPVARARGAIGRVVTELLFRVRKNPALAIASAALFVVAIAGAKSAHHWVVAAAILLPLLWIRAFDDALRPRSLDEVLGSLPGGVSGDWVAKAATLCVLCVAPLLGLLFGNPQDPAIWVAATLGLLAELAWLTAVTWVFRAELLALGTVALWWYVVAFNNVPPADFAGLWSVSAFALAIDALATVALVAIAQTLLRRRV